MKTAVSSTGKTLENNMGLRFGRASGFIVYNIENDDFEFIDNEQNFKKKL